MSTQKEATKKISLIRRIVLAIRKWNEAIILFPIAIFSWVCIPALLRMIDPTTAVYDSGVLMKFMYAVVGMIVCHFTAWLMLRLTMPRVFDYFYYEMPYDLFKQEQLGSKQESINQGQCKRLKYSILLFSLYLLSFIAILATL